MFPSFLDNAKVLYHTPAGNYGTVCLTTGEIADHIIFLAICRYPGDSQYYLFGCNAAYEVVSDMPFDDIPACMNAARLSHGEGLLWIASEN